MVLVAGGGTSGNPKKKKTVPNTGLKPQPAFKPRTRIGVGGKVNPSTKTTTPTVRTGTTRTSPAKKAAKPTAPKTAKVQPKKRASSDNILSRMEDRKTKKPASPNTPAGRQQAAAKAKRVASRQAAADKAAKAVAAGKKVDFVDIPSKATSTKYERNQAIRMRAAQARGVARGTAVKKATPAKGQTRPRGKTTR